MDISSSTRPEVREDLHVEELDGEILIFDPEDDKTYNFNGTAAFVWNLCDGRHELEEIVRAIEETAASAEYQQIRADVEEFLVELYDDRLIHINHESKPNS